VVCQIIPAPLHPLATLPVARMAGPWNQNPSPRNAKSLIGCGRIPFMKTMRTLSYTPSPIPRIAVLFVKLPSSSPSSVTKPAPVKSYAMLSRKST
jgi:hypothetical protein